MIRTLRRKFTVTAMIAVTVLLAALLGGINAVNAVTNAREVRQQLDQLCAETAGFDRDFERDIRPPDFDRGGGGRGLLGPMPAMEALLGARYYRVWADSEGAVTAVDSSHIEYGSEEEAAALFAAAAGKSEGGTGAFRFRTVTLSDGGSMSVFLYTAEKRTAVLRVALLSGLGGLAGWLLMLLFVSFLSKKAIQPLAENMEKQKRFVTDAGHELKTPLAIILANTEALELRQGESKYSKNIREQVQRLSGLTQNLLTLARADESQELTSAEDLDLSALVAEGAAPFREPAELRGLRLSEDIRPGLTAHGSRQQLSQAVSILLDNAVKYCAEGGEIRVELFKEGKPVLRVSNTVTDTSVPAERLFDRFYRADQSRSRASGGYGIGLSAARAIAEAHKGSLTAAYEGGRIVFTLKL